MPHRGPLALLPLHAAGPRNGPRVTDRATSSCTPTLGSLIRARSHRPPRRPQLLAAGVADVPENDENTAPVTGLPDVQSELSALGELFGDAHTLRVGEQAVMPAVLSALSSHPWVRFARHGMHDPDDPANSHLVLYDGPLFVTRVAEQDLSGAELAFLSACHIARGTSTLTRSCGPSVGATSRGLPNRSRRPGYGALPPARSAAGGRCRSHGDEAPVPRSVSGVACAGRRGVANCTIGLHI
ncbi:CHAT domain-containing protein [Streptomyces sp. NPDC021080]|uniref:CHAT domain-containing protein n=1 Tax=Streptomyces sp. NPDC021080 TaxID=3365110 RepID=UPI0037B208AA